MEGSSSLRADLHCESCEVMAKSAGITLSLVVYCLSVALPTSGCPCKAQIIRDQVCRADFVGVIKLRSQTYDAGLNASRYQGTYIKTFRANFIVDDPSTMIWARQLSCGHQRMNLTFVQSQNATEENLYFLIAGGNRRHLTVSICTSIVHQWHKISAYDKKKLTKAYIDKACDCTPGQNVCSEAFNLDFISYIVTF